MKRSFILDPELDMQLQKFQIENKDLFKDLTASLSFILRKHFESESIEALDRKLLEVQDMERQIIQRRMELTTIKQCEAQKTKKLSDLKFVKDKINELENALRLTTDKKGVLIKFIIAEKTLIEHDDNIRQYIEQKKRIYGVHGDE